MVVSGKEAGYLGAVTRMMVVLTMTVVLTMIAAAAANVARAEDGGTDAQALKRVERELRQLRADRARDRKLIEKLEQELDEVRSEDNHIRTSNRQLQNTAAQLQTSNERLQTRTD